MKEVGALPNGCTETKDLQTKLPKLFIEDLEIAENLEITQKSNQIHIKIIGSVYQDFCQQAQKLHHICNSLGCPLCSSLAIALTRTTGKPVTIEKTKPSQDEKTIHIPIQNPPAIKEVIFSPYKWLMSRQEVY